MNSVSGRQHRLARALGALLALAVLSLSWAAEGFIVLQSTTSTQNSGLLEHVLPLFTQQTGIEVRVVAVGSGQALRNAKNGDGDVVLVHSQKDEEDFVANGWGVKRIPVMYNDFIVVGPAADPAKIEGLNDSSEALKGIATAHEPFASRADDSGTHKAELKLWESARVDFKASSGGWYLETGSGMSATLNLAINKQAYALTDRGTWLALSDKHDFRVLVEGDDAGLRASIDVLAGLVGAGTTAARRRRAMAAMSELVGAMVLARAVDDEDLSQEILDAARSDLLNR